MGWPAPAPRGWPLASSAWPGRPSTGHGRGLATESGSSIRRRSSSPTLRPPCCSARCRSAWPRPASCWRRWPSTSRCPTTSAFHDVVSGFSRTWGPPEGGLYTLRVETSASGDGSAVAVDVHDLAEVQLADACFDLRQVAHHQPDHFVRADEALRRGRQVRVAQRTDAPRVGREVIVRVLVVEQLHGRVLERGERGEAARQAQRLRAHDAVELVSPDRMGAGNARQLLLHFDDGLLRLVGLHRRNDEEGALPACGREHTLRAIAPVLVET